MKIILTGAALIFLLLASCDSEEKLQNENSTTDQIVKEPHIALVVDKMNTANYTYLNVSENKNNYWIAVPLMKIEIGETVYFSRFIEMKNFKSETIERTFSSILFVEDARKSSTPDQVKQVHSGAITVPRQNIKIEPLEDGYTVEKIYADRTELNGKIVEIKGKVVKFNPQIMNRNWIHIQDGTGTEKDYDLVVTSNDEVKVGDIIIVEGMVLTDKDFGAGYFFPVVIENARVEIE